MLASIVLDQSFPHYTNLDYISGKVYVRTPTSTSVSSIVVKLEGESRTRLLPPPNPSNDRQKPQLEFHKVCTDYFFASILDLICFDII